LGKSANEPVSKSREGPPIPPRATGIVLGLWVAALFILAFVIVPALFSTCVPQP
jgi:hypothetical protein